MTIDEQLDATTFLHKKDLTALTGLSYPTLHRLQQAGRFPIPHRITSGTSVWLKHEVLTAMQTLIKEAA